jgi:phosphopantothenoylcysteine decarboxylase / phosphopantothenate---cysteine ligase
LLSSQKNDNFARLSRNVKKSSSIRCLVTAGPTREWLDPVRFLSNPSTGKMGFAVADAAHERGWEVDLISGPVILDVKSGVRQTFVETADEMLAACLDLFALCDFMIMAAAVCDHKPALVAKSKLKKSEISTILELEQTPDILAELGRRKASGQKLVGFAAETNDCLSNGERKLREKNLDWIVVNDVSSPERGFASDFNEVTLLGRNREIVPIDLAPKLEVARILLERIDS